MKGVMIGAGYFSHYHLSAWRRMSGVEIIGIADLEKEKAIKLSGGIGVIQCFSDFRQMIGELKPQFIDIITPPPSHLTLLRELLPLGIPIICQKPLAPNFELSLEIQNLINAQSTRVMIHENWRFQPWYRKSKELIINGEIGTVQHLAFHMRMGDGWQEDAYMNRQPYFRTMERLLIHETGIHFVDTFRYLLGDIDEVYARLKHYNPNIKGEDAGIIIFNHKDGSSSILDSSRYHESNKENPRYTFGHMLIEGSGGSLRLQEDGTITLQKLGQVEKKLDYTPSSLGFAGDCVKTTQEHFISCLRSGSNFETNINDYIKSLQVQEAIYQSQEINQVITIK